MIESTLVLVIASPAVLLESIFNEERACFPIDITGAIFLPYDEIVVGEWPSDGDIVSSYCSDNLSDFQEQFARIIQRNEVSAQIIQRFRYIHFVHATESIGLTISEDRHESSAFTDRYLPLHSGRAVEIPESEEPNLPSEWDDLNEVL